jgi:hypothetical protein
MKKSSVLLLTLFLTGGILLAQEQKHTAGDMLLGIGTGAGFGGKWDELDYEIWGSTGVSFDYYPLDWLSISGGASIYLNEFVSPPETPAEVTLENFFETFWAFTDGIFRFPVSVSVPLEVHANIPRAEWLYTGIGFSVQIPFMEMYGFGTHPLMGAYTTLYGDLGFDYTDAKRGGRFFFRVGHNLMENAHTTIGFIWQATFKLRNGR